MRRFSILAALLLLIGLAWSANSASAQTTFAVQTPVVAATTAVTPVYWRGYGYRPYGAYYRPYGAYYRPYGAYYRPYGAYYRPYGYGYGYGVRPYVGIGVY
jgi:hypothetical protein